MTEKLLKTELNPNQSINQSINRLAYHLTTKYSVKVYLVSDTTRIKYAKQRWITFEEINKSPVMIIPLVYIVDHYA